MRGKGIDHPCIRRTFDCALSNGDHQDPVRPLFNRWALAASRLHAHTDFFLIHPTRLPPSLRAYTDEMTIDLARVRRDTRACETVTHFNNAGASLPPAIVADTIREHLRAEEAFGGYEAGALVSGALDGVRETLGQLVGGSASEIALLDGSTRAFQTAVYSLPWKRGDVILASEAEYGSNVYAYGYLKRRFGVKTEYIPDDDHGQIDVEALRAAIDARTKLIAVTHVPTFSGLINPVAEVGEVARAAGVPFLLDACQSIGQLQVDVKAMGCDMLSAAGRKYLRGPRGTGFLWVREGLIAQMDPAYADQHSGTWISETDFRMADDARRFETFERSIALQLGLGAAARYALDRTLIDIESRVTFLAAGLRGMLADIPGVTVHDRGERLCGIVTFTVDGFTAEEVRVTLREHHINTWIVGAHMARRTFPAHNITEVTRASVHYYNTEDELARACDVIRELTN